MDYYVIVYNGDLKMKEFNGIWLEDAEKAVSEVIRVAKSEEDDPIAITIIGINGEVIIQAAMNGAMPASIELSKNKAYTALMTKRETAFWADQRNRNSSSGSRASSSSYRCIGKTLLGGEKNAEYRNPRIE